MNQCKHCKVLMDENLHKCPLCHRAVGDKKLSSENPWYPSYDMEKRNPSRGFLFNLILFLAIAVISTCLLINLLTDARHLWFLYVAGPVLYLLLLINNTILSKTHAGMKILLQVLGISGILFMIDFLSGYYRWSVNVVIPFLVIAGTFLITIIICTKKMLWNEYVGYVFVMIFLGFMPILLYFIRVSNSMWASSVSALYALLTTVGMVLFSDKKLKNEFLRRFHF